MKNKKGAKQQKFIQQVEKQVKSGGLNPRKVDDPNAKKLEKEKKLKEQQELALIFKPVQTQKVEKGKFRMQTFFLRVYLFSKLF